MLQKLWNVDLDYKRKAGFGDIASDHKWDSKLIVEKQNTKKGKRSPKSLKCNFLCICHMATNLHKSKTFIQKNYVFCPVKKILTIQTMVHFNKLQRLIG